jgi:hypothetical protein
MSPLELGSATVAVGKETPGGNDVDDPKNIVVPWFPATGPLLPAVGVAARGGLTVICETIGASALVCDCEAEGPVERADGPEAAF